MPRAEGTSTIFDLGYAHYGGGHAGRFGVGFALYVFSLRAVFGLGRRAWSKVIPFGLAAVTFVPAVVQLGIASLTSEVVEIFRPEDYYGFINWTLAIFVALTATDLVGRDRRHQVLALYFARGLTRDDYVLAKLAAATTALLALTLLPQTVLFVGNGLAVDDLSGYLADNWRDIPAILVSAVGLSLYLATLGLVVASTTTRRTFAAGAIIGYFAVSSAVARGFVEFGAGPLGEWSPLLAAFHVLSGFTYWVFSAEPSPSSAVALSGLALGWFGVALALTTAGGIALFFRSYRRLRL